MWQQVNTLNQVIITSPTAPKLGVDVAVELGIDIACFVAESHNNEQ